MKTIPAIAATALLTCLASCGYPQPRTSADVQKQTKTVDDPYLRAQAIEGPELEGGDKTDPRADVFFSLIRLCT